MTSMIRECDVVKRLWVEAASGRELAPPEVSFIGAHAARCPACRAESDSLRRLREIDGPGPAPALDDLARRRWIDAVLERADDARPERAAPEEPSRFLRVAFVAGIAAAVFLAVFSALWFTSGRGEQAVPPQLAVPPPAPRGIGRVLMTSGDSASQGGLDDSGLAVGSALVTREGISVAALDTGVLLRLGPESAASIVRAEKALCEIRLERGSLLVSVDPNRKGRKVRVLVDDGAVEVKGTIFRVDREAGGATSVGVYRGEVLVSEPGGARAVHIGERVELGNPAVLAIDDGERAEVESAADAFGALDDKRTSVLEVQSLPRGATVAIDGVAIGRTPLTASLRPGYRRLDLSLEGRESVRELLPLAEGARTSRAFDLAVVEPPPGELSAADNRSTPARVETSAGAAPKVPTPTELLDTARDLRAQGDFTGAIAAYERLVAAYPDAPVARSALVSLGQLYLDQGGNPARGLAMFRKYLASAKKGALAQEAAFGVASAHRALGDTAAERAALEAFLRDFGDSSQAPRARARLDQIQ